MFVQAKWKPHDARAYSYLLGIYLGDGYISQANRSVTLEITLDPRYPGIVEECVVAIRQAIDLTARSSLRVGTRGRAVRIVARGSVLLLAFPQHGPGKKHGRKIKLESWQQDIVDLHPKPFLRGLIHSDGSRSVNRFTTRLPSGPRQYAYARYFFTNFSEDILEMFCSACERLGVRWTRSSQKNISISNRTDVALLDSFVGPKR